MELRDAREENSNSNNNRRKKNKPDKSDAFAKADIYFIFFKEELRVLQLVERQDNDRRGS